VLAGSAAYAVGEALKVPVGLARAPLEAKAFYGAIAAATLAGVAANFLGLDPIRALFWSGVVNGIVAAPVLAIMVRLATRPEVMGDLTIGRTLQIGGWIAVAVTTAGVLGITVSGALQQAF
jgi:Mn2+/Fe2+ NRAMP family transporter